MWDSSSKGRIHKGLLKQVEYTMCVVSSVGKVNKWGYSSRCGINQLGFHY